MRPIKFNQIVIVLGVIAFPFLVYYFYLILLFVDFFQPRRPGAVIDTWEDVGTKFTVRATSYYEEHGGPVPGGYFRFECALKGEDEWQEIMMFRHDDPGPVPFKQVRRLGDDVAYLFMGWMFAVTSDGGKTWSVWSADKDLPNWECCNYGLIRDVVLEADGTGKMVLKPIPGRRGEVPRLITNDFGRTWKPG